MANNFNLSNYQYTNTKFVSCPGWNIHPVEGSVSWVSELENYVGSCLPAVGAIHPGLVWHKMIRYTLALWPSSLGVGVGLTVSPHRNSIVSKPWQQKGHDPKMGCCTTEEVCTCNTI